MKLSLKHPAKKKKARSIRDQGRSKWDLFVCHATEDKEEVVRPLVNLLIKEGFHVWYDEYTLRLGDSLRRSIDEGLANSEYGIVVLSPSFFAKNWPQTELDGLAARERDGQKVILPVWHNAKREYKARYSPTLADRLAVSTEKGVQSIVNAVREVVKPKKIVVEDIGRKVKIIIPPGGQQTEAIRRMLIGLYLAGCDKIYVASSNGSLTIQQRQMLRDHVTTDFADARIFETFDKKLHEHPARVERVSLDASSEPFGERFV